MATAPRNAPFDETDLVALSALERRALWLASWTIHNANHIRESRDGLKVGGHQSSCASVATIMTALYFHVLTPEDRVAVKPHAAPVFHAIQYLMGKQDVSALQRFRALGGAQSYPSRTKDKDDVDFSTGSVGLGVGVTLFASLIQDYVHRHGLAPDGRAPGRMIAVMGDAELDEGNIFEALLEGWKHDVRNLWWVIDYNRQSLDGVVNDFLFQRIADFFKTVGWNVVTVKYGKRLQRAFQGPGGAAIKGWIDSCPNDLYSALTFKGGAAFRARMAQDLAGDAGVAEFLGAHDDAALAAIMTNLGGHDLEALLEAFHGVEDDRPHCFVAYTIKGFGTPLAGHKDNHAGLMTPDQMAGFRQALGVAEGAEWERLAGLDGAIEAAALEEYIRKTRFRARPAPFARGPILPVAPLEPPTGESQSTQGAFGKLMNDLAARRDAVSARIVTTSPDVTVSTNLSAWVNRRGVFSRTDRPDAFRQNQVASPIKWDKGPTGQHLELGIAENNLFLLLAAAGLSEQLFGARLLPVGTLYDPFISRGLDSLNYACYQDARFLLVATPSGITLAPEGGAHQSIATPLIGLSQDGLAAFEPAYADELTVLIEWALDYMQRDGQGVSEIEWLRDVKGGSVYLRLSTRSITQPKRALDAAARHGIVAGGYWLREPAPGAELAIAYTGAVAPEALAAWEAVLEDVPGAGLLAVTSADRLDAGWRAAETARQRGGAAGALSHVETLLAPLAPDAGIVTVLDGHPATLSWLGGVHGHKVRALGVDSFGQSADLTDLYALHRIDAESILDACAAALGERVRPRGVASARPRAAE